MICGLLVITLLYAAPRVMYGNEDLGRRTNGKYQVTLRLPPDGLFAQEENDIELRIEDTSRPDTLLGFSPVIRAQVDAGIDMPSMPGMPSYREVSHPEGVPGDYGVHPTFAHGGGYLLRLSITPPQDRAFHVEFPLHVQDAGTAARRKKRPPRFSLELVSDPKTPKAGEPVELRLVVRERERPREVFSSFDVAHEKLMHLVIVRTDLTQFAHEHPTLSADGVFRLRHIFQEAGEYRLFADVAPKGAGSQVMSAKLKVSGKRPQLSSIPSSRAGSIIVGDLQFEWRPASNPLPAKTSTRVEVSVRNRVTGQPAGGLEKYLGAAGHLILIHEDAATLVHSHPLEIPDEAANPINFLVRLPKSGRYRGWVQVQRNGIVVTADVILEAVENP